ncbi:response regulator [Tsuneonella sp. HG222]
MSRILIVEDEILVASEMSYILEDGGHQCVGIAPDLASAETFFDEKLDLALVDLNLRDGLTGPEIGRRLSSAGVPVIFVTANPAQLHQGVAGTIGVLTKPTDEATLLAAVNFGLERASGHAAVAPPTMRLFG